MEKLSLDKFQDVKLENKQLSFIHAGDTCTGGGGGRNTYNIELSNGCFCMIQDYSYDSDSVDECGNTSYTGWCSETTGCC